MRRETRRPSFARPFLRIPPGKTTATGHSVDCCARLRSFDRRCFRAVRGRDQPGLFRLVGQHAGVDLLLEAVPLLPADGWHLHITGSGRLADNVAKFAGDQRWREKVTFHGVVPGAAYGI